MKKAFLIGILILCTAVINSESIRVEVWAFSADSTTERRLESFIKRELRSIGDVKVVEMGGDWILMVQAIEPETTSGGKTGAVICYVNQLRPLFIEAELRLELVETFWTSGPRWGLRGDCETIVADFDAGILEPYRQNNYEY